MSDANGPTQDAGTAYDALNASYRAMDEYMRQTQLVAEQLWTPWLRPFMRGASPFIPPEQWIRAYGDMAMAWMSMAQSMTGGTSGRRAAGAVGPSTWRENGPMKVQRKEQPPRQG